MFLNIYTNDWLLREETYVMHVDLTDGVFLA